MQISQLFFKFSKQKLNKNFIYCLYSTNNPKKYIPNQIINKYESEILKGKLDKDIKQETLIKELEKISFLLSNYKKPILQEYELVKIENSILITEQFFDNLNEANKQCDIEKMKNPNEKYFVRPIKYQSILSTTLKKRHSVLPEMKISRLPTEVNYDDQKVYNSDPNLEIINNNENSIDELYNKPSSIVIPDQPNYKIPRGLYIHGQVGTGKSMIMKYFYDFAPVDSCNKRRIHFHEFMQEIHEQIHQFKMIHYNSPENLSQSVKHNYYSENDAIVEVSKRIAKTYTLLCLDEFQVTDIADAIILSNIFEILFKFGTVIVSTSNQSPDVYFYNIQDLYSGGLNRHIFLPFITLLTRWCKVFNIDSDIDYRQTKYIPNSSTYYYPCNTENFNKIKNEYNDLFNKGTSYKLQICRGRDMPLELKYNNTALIDFNTLCKEERGTLDYEVLSKTFETVIIKNVLYLYIQIPTFSMKNHDELARFISLIDHLYDHHIRLICLADNSVLYYTLQIDDLFKNILYTDIKNDIKQNSNVISLQQGINNAKRNLIFRSKRTISRLYDMTGQSYKYSFNEQFFHILFSVKYYVKLSYFL